MLTGAKIAGKRLFGLVGLDIRKKRPEEVARASMRGTLRQLASLGFAPATIFDVGVLYGTPELYEEFPESSILLIEPLAAFEARLQEICGRYKAQYVLAAAGAVPGTATLNVHTDRLRGPRLLKGGGGGGGGG